MKSKKILILGGTGMLGHQLFARLSMFHDVWATVRRDPIQVPSFAHTNRSQILQADALEFTTITRAIQIVQPEIVINCIGLIKQREDAKNRLLAIDINSRFPHLVANLCTSTNSRLIHISTDCVFSGSKGMYTESEPTDSYDVYGKSKSLGEIVDAEHVLTIRTSLIGRELFTKYSLVEWFLAQKGTVNGFKNAIFSGFPTRIVADILQEYIIPNPELNGLYHVSAAPISKFDLLHLLKKAYNSPVDIQANTDVQIDRSLDSTRFRKATGFSPLSWEQMIQAMTEDSFYDE